MSGFVEGVDRGQSTLVPAQLDDYVTEDNPVRAVDVFVEGLDLDKLGFVGVQPLDTGDPATNFIFRLLATTSDPGDVASKRVNRLLKANDPSVQDGGEPALLRIA
jgi:hypothetical protein